MVCALHSPEASQEHDTEREHRTFGSDRFDMVHGRFLMGSVSSHASLYKSVYDSLKPGGWFEIVEMECGTVRQAASHLETLADVSLSVLR